MERRCTNKSVAGEWCAQNLEVVLGFDIVQLEEHSWALDHKVLGMNGRDNLLQVGNEDALDH